MRYGRLASKNLEMRGALNSSLPQESRVYIMESSECSRRSGEVVLHCSEQRIGRVICEQWSRERSVILGEECDARDKGAKGDEEQETTCEVHGRGSLEGQILEPVRSAIEIAKH